MSTIPVAKLLWLVVRFDLVTVDVAQGAAIRSLHGHILTVVGNDAATLLRDQNAGAGLTKKNLFFFLSGPPGGVD